VAESTSEILPCWVTKGIEELGNFYLRLNLGVPLLLFTIDETNSLYSNNLVDGGIWSSLEVPTVHFPVHTFVYLRNLTKIRENETDRNPSALEYRTMFKFRVSFEFHSK
jgi:hypothetical protein